MNNHILTPKQIKFLELFGSEKALTAIFYFSGGTPLAEFYLQHRYSEDLDFFSDKEFDITSINIFLKKNTEALGIKKIDFEQSYNRNLFFLHFEDEILKTEFTYYPFPRIDTSAIYFNIPTDSPLDIAVNKLFTIYQRTKARDYIDLFFLCKKYEYSVSELISKARSKFDWHIDLLQLGTQFSKVNEAQDMPRMLIDFDNQIVNDFFLAEAKSLRETILEQ